MRPIDSMLHGILDYVVSVALIVMPTVLGLGSGPETWVPVSLGIVGIMYSLITHYELGAVRVLPFRVHLTLDAFHGVVLALSPWLFGFTSRVYLPHLLFGLAELVVILLTRPAVDTKSGVGRLR